MYAVPATLKRALGEVVPIPRFPPPVTMTLVPVEDPITKLGPEIPSGLMESMPNGVEVAIPRYPFPSKRARSTPPVAKPMLLAVGWNIPVVKSVSQVNAGALWVSAVFPMNWVVAVMFGAVRRFEAKVRDAESTTADPLSKRSRPVLKLPMETSESPRNVPLPSPRVDVAVHTGIPPETESTVPLAPIVLFARVFAPDA
jgi:hypothetical protein